MLLIAILVGLIVYLITRVQMIVLELTWLRKYIVRILSQDRKQSIEAHQDGPESIPEFPNKDILKNVDETLINSIVKNDRSDDGEFVEEVGESDRESSEESDASGVELEEVDDA